ncbi:MAG: nuoJ, partial [Phycisphaerales bacterium]|nr:nuoJ [Phycisphaerales bacterium]
MTGRAADILASLAAPGLAAATADGTVPAAEVGLFYLFAALTAGAAVAVVASRDVVRTAVALLFALAGVAGLFVLLSAEFLAAVQLVVYVGGTLILIVFGVMLTAQSPFARSVPTGREVAVGVVLAAVLVAALLLALPAGGVAAAA